MKRGPMLKLGVVVLAACIGSFSCRQDDGNNNAPRIAISLPNTNQPYYREFREGLESGASTFGYELLFADGGSNPTRQVDQIRTFVAQGVDALVVCPYSSKSAGVAIAQANRADIPVFTAKVANTPSMGKVIAHISSDDRAGGRQAAELLTEAIDREGSVAILTRSDDSSATDRIVGFRQRLMQYARMQIVAQVAVDGDRFESSTAMENLLKSHAKLSGVFATDDELALGVVMTLESQSMVGEVQIIGYGASSEARQEIGKGKIFADVVEFPKHAGELTIRTIHEHLSGGVVPSTIRVDIGRCTLESP